MNPQETQQVIARDEKWVPSTERVKISPTNVILETTMHQKEKTFQVIIYVIKNSTCFKAFTIFAEKCVVDAEVFRKILDICPRVKGEEFTEVQDEEATFTFLIDLGYKGPLHKHTNIYMNHMHQPWRTLAAIINKCLSGKTASNDKLRKSRIEIDHMKEKKSRRETMPFPRFTKVIINQFLSQHKSFSKLKFQHYHTIKDDGIISKLKFVRIGEDYQEYGLPIPDMMLNDKIKQSESYQMFLKYCTSLIPSKKSRDTMQALKESKRTNRRQLGTGGSSEGTGRIPGVPDESTVVSATLSEGTEDSQLMSNEEEKKDNNGDADDEDEDDDHISDIEDTDDEDVETESDED
ncbi:hypothetical protein Tco_0730518 [Tanacetum coccineum]|uniref:Uncharacterized protein n=1 Tax=Tanacetum coccineum TaxID=301880 RepID=A0ABQ4YUT2_9ASTR